MQTDKLSLQKYLLMQCEFSAGLKVTNIRIKLKHGNVRNELKKIPNSMVSLRTRVSGL